MRKEWSTMTVKVVGQVEEVVQGWGKHSPIADDGGVGIANFEEV